MLGGFAILFVLLVIWPTFVVSNISYVGYGHHILNGDIIQIMGTAKRIVKSNEDLKEYKGPNSCNVALDEKNGDIILNYNKVKETGCVVDLLTDSWDGQFEFNATVDNGDKELKECLKPRSSGNGTKYKLLMLGNEEIPSTTSTTKITTTSKTTTETKTTTKNQVETTSTKLEPSPTSPSSVTKKSLFIIVVVIIVIFIATFIVLLLCLSLCCKKSEKNQTVKMATARSTDSYMIADRSKPKIEASPTYDDTPTQVTYATDLQVKKYVSSTNIDEGTTVVGKQTVNDTMDDKRMSNKDEERSKGESTFE